MGVPFIYIDPCDLRDLGEGFEHLFTGEPWVGSLSFRRSPCVRENCPACMSGEQHPSHVLYGRLKGRRVAVYVPEELVPEVRRGLDNGRALQGLLQQAAPRYVKALKRERPKAPKSRKS